ncbi:MAG TPA: MbnP family copper-binding protein [Allosphingosinicella sp.]|nr:MbnP family copper-binding protein [Allosphingosinicella sp.]
MKFAPIIAALLAASPAFAQDGSQAVQIRFDARAGAQPLRCGQSYSGIGSSSATLTLQDFRIYVSAVRLIDATGHEVPVALTPDGQWQSAAVALLDFEDGTGNCNGNAVTNHVVRGTVPAGDYRGLVFEIGVPQSVNHQDPTLAAAPLNVTALTWPWRIGYKFTTIDLETSGGRGGPNAATGFSIHLGSTDCGEGSPVTPPSTPCRNGNRPSYRLDRFDPAATTVVLDLAALLAGTDITVNAPGSMSGCMAFPDDDDCVAVMDRFGLPFRGRPSAGQQWVRAE